MKSIKYVAPIRNDYDSDYVGNAKNLLHPINQKLNNTFISKIKDALFLRLNYFPDIFISLVVQTTTDTNKVSKIGLNCNYVSNLQNIDQKEVKDKEIIQNTINSFFLSNGYNINDPISFIEEMYKVIPSLENYLKIIEE